MTQEQGCTCMHRWCRLASHYGSRCRRASPQRSSLLPPMQVSNPKPKAMHGSLACAPIICETAFHRHIKYVLTDLYVVCASCARHPAAAAAFARVLPGAVHVPHRRHPGGRRRPGGAGQRLLSTRSTGQQPSSRVTK